MNIVVTEAIGVEGLDILDQSGHNIIKTFGTTYDELLGKLADADAMIVRTHYPIDKNLIDHAPNLKVIGMHGVGLNHIDVDYAKSKGIEVLNVPSANATSVVELTVGLLLAVARKIPAVANDVRAGNWRPNDKQFVGTELEGKTLGVIGLGKIGLRVALICQAIGMNIVGYDPYISDRSTIPFPVVDTVAEVIQQVDALTLHVPLTPETKDLVTSEMLAGMKDGLILINAARGGIISEKVIIEGLRSGKIAGAGIDCLEQEPVDPNNPLLKMDNVIATPHMGSRTTEALGRVSSIIAEKVLETLAK